MPTAQPLFQVCAVALLRARALAQRLHLDDHLVLDADGRHHEGLRPARLQLGAQRELDRRPQLDVEALGS